MALQYRLARLDSAEVLVLRFPGPIAISSFFNVPVKTISYYEHSIHEKICELKVVDQGDFVWREPRRQGGTRLT